MGREPEKDVRHLPLEELKKLPPGIYAVTRDQLYELGVPLEILPSEETLLRIASHSGCRLLKQELPPKTDTKLFE